METLQMCPAWQALVEKRDRIANQSLQALFAADPQRFEHYSIHAAGIWFDASKQPLDAELLGDLVALAEARELPRWREALFSGERINETEGRAALHTALRAADEATLPEVKAARERMASLAEAIRSGEWQSITGAPITDVINIGIGGSDLGPRLAVDALAPLADGPRIHFVANIDGVEMARTLAQCDPRSTLVLVASKSFGTSETLANAHEAMAWLRRDLADDAAISRQVIGITADPAHVRSLGLDPDLALPLWDWVGGRYSLWSTVGFSVMLAIGPKAFEALLSGAAAMDQHFSEAPLSRNMPVLQGLLSVLHGTLLGRRSQAVVPYTERLRYLPAYLQQLVMESNGKSVDRSGQPLSLPAAAAIWGQTGTPAQHAFFQALHQGTEVIPVDFIGVASPVAGERGEPLELAANLFAQSQALMQGTSVDPERPAAYCPGNRPSNTLLLHRLDPAGLGALIALYEHRTFVEAVVWGINPFDQYGVELGKRLARDLRPLLGGGAASMDVDGSTAGLVRQFLAWRHG